MTPLNAVPQSSSRRLEPATGIEPATCALQVRCTSNCAILAFLARTIGLEPTHPKRSEWISNPPQYHYAYARVWWQGVISCVIRNPFYRLYRSVRYRIQQLHDLPGASGRTRTRIDFSIYSLISSQGCYHYSTLAYYKGRLVCFPYFLYLLYYIFLKKSNFNLHIF